MKDLQSQRSGFLLVGTDITERRIMEEQLANAQKLESIGRLAAGIAHEINTPAQYLGSNLRFIHSSYLRILDLLIQYEELKDAIRKGLSETELTRMIDPFQEGSEIQYLLQEFPIAVEQSMDGVDRITVIVRAMRDFSHPGSETKSMANLNEALQSTLEVARNEWKYVAEVELDSDPQLPLIQCLPAELNQVFLNIIINAVHAIQAVVGEEPEVKGKITIQTRHDSGFVEIRISDSGTGIPDNIRDRIFDPFFTTKEVGKGTGQGLAIAHNVIVNKHGGSINIESEMGRGSTFILRLPYSVEEVDKTNV